MPLPAVQLISVPEYVRAERSPISRLAHQWELHSAILLSPAEERNMVREPAQAVPDAIADRIGPVRLLLVPYISCTKEGDFVSFVKPEGEAHTSVWVDLEGSTRVVLACRELDAHDTGFELLACVAELLRPRITEDEAAQFQRLLQDELRQGVTGEIDEEAARAKQAFLSRSGRRRNQEFEAYSDVSLVETVAEYMHGLWHDVQIRVGPEHLPLSQLRPRLALLSRLFPPNEGYSVFDEAIATEEPDSNDE
ncbi:MAG TPA: hypothetical protein VG860_23885 [Terriglobia bacterium]|nr:hypothetical protein [Terriglobia bacterium]